MNGSGAKRTASNARSMPDGPRDGWTAMGRLLQILVAALLLLQGAPVQARRTPERSYRWAERMLFRSTDPATALASRTVYPRLRIRGAANAFQHVLATYGPSTRAYLGLAEAEMASGEPGRAVKALEEAVKLSPGSRSARHELHEAREATSIKALAGQHMPEGQSVLEVARYPVEGHRDLWLVLSGKLVWSKEGRLIQSTDSRLTLFRNSVGSLRKVSESVLGPGYTHGYFNEIQLYGFDLTGDRQLDAVVVETMIGASWSPSHLDAFTWRGGRMIKLLGVQGHEPICVRDLNHDGRYEAMNSYAIGVTMCHADQPRWRDVFAYRNGGYQLADWVFPGEYRHWVRDLRHTLRDYPKDPVIWKYLGITYDILGHRGSANRAFARARELFLAGVADKIVMPDARVQSELRSLRKPGEFQ